MNVFGGILELVCVSVYRCALLCVLVSVCVRNTSFCQSAGGGLTLSQTSPGFYMSAEQVF